MDKMCCTFTKIRNYRKTTKHYRYTTLKDGLRNWETDKNSLVYFFK